MKITNMSMINILTVLSKFPLASGKIGYAIARNKRILQNELSDFESVRNSLLQKYGEQKEDGSYYIDPNTSDNIDDFNKEISEVLNVEVDVELWHINKDEYEMPYSDTATVQDYDTLEMLLIKDERAEEG